MITPNNHPHPIHDPIGHLLTNMIPIEGGTFLMGSENGSADEKPVHPVTIPSFELARYPVSLALWKQVMGTKHERSFLQGLFPVERVSWSDCQKFIQRLNNRLGDTFRLPSEAEWEYAARGGEVASLRQLEYAGSDDLHEVAWFWDNSFRQTQLGSALLPNPLGLVGMSGNVWEWCQDTWNSSYEGAPDDGSAWEEVDSSRVVRGGSWDNSDLFTRVAYRFDLLPEDRNRIIGFRLARK
ncbi:formylglycine-generating enzyme family protein [Pontibacter sp. G13]|uniref:formylglycine-generating enzyme family protein n=1 Tax=Pontibacter sp. G13 TaxID=3074898 RepID=UPI00288A5E7A|nr:formylglycine-generating enzyme family protein [Pontibacter sp. G13]WNJ19628.1 formylglycine-generating enzyme family protein [Pontibacter sp. G13]